jgi:hypothetical protein
MTQCAPLQKKLDVFALIAPYPLVAAGSAFEDALFQK